MVWSAPIGETLTLNGALCRAGSLAPRRGQRTSRCSRRCRQLRSRRDVLILDDLPRDRFGGFGRGVVWQATALGEGQNRVVGLRRSAAAMRRDASPRLVGARRRRGAAAVGHGRSNSRQHLTSRRRAWRFPSDSGWGYARTRGGECSGGSLNVKAELESIGSSR